MVHAFSPSTWEAEAGGFLNSRSAWSTEFQDSQGYTERDPVSEKKNLELWDTIYSLQESGEFLSWLKFVLL